MSMVEEENTEEKSGVAVSGSAMATGGTTAEISYISGFPKKQLEYAQSARDKAGKIEVIFGGDDVLMFLMKRIESINTTLSQPL